MRMLDRRIFLGSSLGGMAAAMTFPFALAANERSRLTDGVASPLPDFAPDTLFLTWQQYLRLEEEIQWSERGAFFGSSPALYSSWQQVLQTQFQLSQESYV